MNKRDRVIRHVNCHNIILTWPPRPDVITGLVLMRSCKLKEKNNQMSLGDVFPLFRLVPYRSSIQTAVSLTSPLVSNNTVRVIALERR